MSSLNKNKDNLHTNTSLEKFLEHYNIGLIYAITLDEIPNDAMAFFEGMSRRFILPEKYIEKNFDNSFVIYHFNHNTYQTHVVIQEKEYSNSSKTIEKLIYLYDSNNNIKIGHGEIRFDYQSKDKFFMNKPFVGFNGTEEYFQRQGYGINRLKVMNALSYMFFNLPLNSDNTITSEAKSLWEKLEKSNDAKRYEHEIRPKNERIVYDRFVFTS